MSTPRQRFTDVLCNGLDMILPGAGQGAQRRKELDALSEPEFHAYVEKVRSGEEIPSITVPNLGKHNLTVEHNFKVADKVGLNYFHRCWVTDSETGVTHLTNEEYFVGPLPVRRQRQFVREKMSIPEGTHHIDELSGQVTGPSKGSKISLPELHVLNSQGLSEPIVELIKYRGGDVKGMQAMYRQLMETGRVSMNVLQRTPTQVKSTQTLSIILNAMMLSNTLLKRQEGP